MIGNEDGIIEEEMIELCGSSDINDLILYCRSLKKKLAQAEGATQMALQHLGLQGADHDEFCRFKYGCNVFGDELEEEE